MKVRTSIVNPDAVEATLTITMTMGEWKQLADDLPSRYPLWKLSQAISNAIYKLRRETIEAVEEE